MVKFLSSKEGMGKAVTKMFRDLDLDGSGDVDIAEFVGGMKKLGLELTDAQFSALHHDCDTDGDGSLTLKEFVNSCKCHTLLCTEYQLGSAVLLAHI